MLKKKKRFQFCIELTNRHKRFILFLVVGGINTLFGYTLFSLFVYLGVHHTLAVLLATCLGILFNFQTIGRIVFKNADQRLFFKFLLIYGIQYFTNISLIKIFLMVLHNIYISGAIAALICAVLTYSLNKHFVFTVKTYEVN